MHVRTQGQSRRTEGVRVRGRSARVVEGVLRATIEELGRVGYAALRVEDVASLSGVNKTTIYRRWPTKADLVGAALREMTELAEVPDTGSLREDLLVLMHASVARSMSPEGQGLIRMLQAELAHPELDALARALREENRKPRIAVIERAVARGELPAGTDACLVVELLMSPIYARIIRRNEGVSDAFIESVVDLVLAGARAGGAVRSEGAR